MSLLVCDLACRHFDSPIASLDRPARLGDDRQSSERPLNAIPGFEPLLTEKQAAELLNVPASTLKYWRDCGDGPAYYKLGTGRRSPVRYDAAVLEEWLRAHLRVPKARATAEASHVAL
jgi:hypothetical protein